MNITLGKLFLEEIEAEKEASRKCLERIPADAFDWKPHEKSMPMGRLALIVAEVPRWVSTALEVGEINFGSFKHAEVKGPEDLVKEFNKNMDAAQKALEGASDEQFRGTFTLKMGDKVLMSDTKLNTVRSSINHWVHHRGQLTVYMKLKGIPVPSIYGPS